MNNYSHIFDGRQPLNLGAIVLTTLGIIFLVAVPPLGFAMLVYAIVRQCGHGRRKASRRERELRVAARRQEESRIRAWKAV